MLVRSKNRIGQILFVQARELGGADTKRYEVIGVAQYKYAGVSGLLLTAIRLYGVLALAVALMPL